MDTSPGDFDEQLGDDDGLPAAWLCGEEYYGVGDSTMRSTSNHWLRLRLRRARYRLRRVTYHAINNACVGEATNGFCSEDAAFALNASCGWSLTED